MFRLEAKQTQNQTQYRTFFLKLNSRVSCIPNLYSIGHTESQSLETAEKGGGEAPMGGRGGGGGSDGGRGGWGGGTRRLLRH